MPVCPRCGKSLSSEQALAYHMNKKFKCNTWKCMKCSKILNTKFDLNIHEMKCMEHRCEHPSFDVLRIMFQKLNTIIYELDNDDNVKCVNPAYYKKYSNDIIGAKLDLSDYQTIADNNVKLVIEQIN